MTLKRIGKCTICASPTSEKRQFLVTADLFDTKANPLRGNVLKEIDAWRLTPLLCKVHR